MYIACTEYCGWNGAAHVKYGVVSAIEDECCGIGRGDGSECRGALDRIWAAHFMLLLRCTDYLALVPACSWAE